MKNVLRLAVLAVSFATLSACGIDDAVVGGDDGSQMDESELTIRGRFETFEGRDGQTYFHLLAGNGEKVLASQGYASVAGAEAGIASVKANGTSDQRYLLRTASDGASYFVLTAANGAIIGVSEMYASQSNATRAIASVMQVVKNTVAQGTAQQVASHFDVFRGIDSKYYFHLKANNGEIVMQSQSYASKSGATAGVSSVTVNGAIAGRYSVLPAADGRFYFVLRAVNGQIIGRGEMYQTRSGAEQGVAACVALLATRG